MSHPLHAALAAAGLLSNGGGGANQNGAVSAAGHSLMVPSHSASRKREAHDDVVDCKPVADSSMPPVAKVQRG